MTHIPEDILQTKNWVCDGFREGLMDTVLVVDDHPLVRNLLIRSLSAAGYLVLEAANAAEAVKIASVFEAGIHLMVIDYALEDGNGVDIATRIAAIRPAIRVLVVSGYPEEQVMGSVAGSGNFLFLSKPFSLDILQEKLRQMSASRPKTAGT